MPLAPGDRFGRFQIEELLGAGGMGQVFRAHDEALDRKVAIKIVRPPPGADAAAREAFERRLVREARAAAALAHPNAIVVHDVGEVEGQAYIAMELVEGRPLSAYVGDGSVPLAQRLRWIADIARALEAAHACGLVHRDVKPSNVMVRQDGAIKVLDFGIARRVVSTSASADETLTGDDAEIAFTRSPCAQSPAGTLSADGRVVGTPLYMAPEQMRGEEVDARADQFSWGVLAYELLAGKKPWGDTLSLPVLAEALSRAPPSLHAAVPELPRHVEETVLRALSKARAARFASMAEIVHRLESGTAARVARRWPLAAFAGALCLAGAVAWWVRPHEVEVPSPAPSAASATAEPARYDATRLTAIPTELLDGMAAARLSADRRSLLYLTGGDLWSQPVAGGPRRRLARFEGDSVHFQRAQRVLVNAEGALWEAFEDGAPPRLLWAHDPPSQLTADARTAVFSRKHDLLAAPVDEDAGPAVALGCTPYIWNTLMTGDDAIVCGDPSRTSEHARLTWQPLDGGLRRTLVQDDALDTNVGVMTFDAREPDQLVYALQHTPSRTHAELVAVTVAADGTPGVPRTLWRAPTGDITALDARGDPILVTTVRPNDDVWQLRLAPGVDRLEGEPTKSIAFEWYDEAVGWLPDGRLVVWSDREGRFGVFAVDAGGQVEKLHGGDAQVDGAETLPDGDVIAWETTPADAGDPGRCALVRVTPGHPDAARTLVEVPRDGAPDDASVPRCRSVVHCARTGACFVRERVGEELVLSTFDVDHGRKGREVERETSDAPWAGRLHHWDVSPDGAFVLAAREGVEWIDTRTGAARRQHLDDFVQFVESMPDGRHFLMTSAGARGFTLRACDRDVAHCVPLWGPQIGSWPHDVRAAPDGRTVAFTVRKMDPDLWLLEPR